jgi:hypothetical protein
MREILVKKIELKDVNNKMKKIKSLIRINKYTQDNDYDRRNRHVYCRLSQFTGCKLTIR